MLLAVKNKGYLIWLQNILFRGAWALLSDPVNLLLPVGMALFWALRWKVCLWVIGPWSIIAKFCWHLYFALSLVWIRAFYCWIYEISLWKRKIIFLSALILPMRTKTQKVEWLAQHHIAWAHQRCERLTLIPMTVFFFQYIWFFHNHSLSLNCDVPDKSLTQMSLGGIYSSTFVD